ncbi:helix-turn-helix domain-containing protein [candidate division KSB1 bacterium]|nr:helix-turn-helix domain-containing protein [candidate division KSB1 bacterium]NIR73319.1 helix-turn-helix domain-containing protein [candidate division KSB1 bacterium]NIS27025.1 helix-turn-helix domain-containing protein [candidate division KSB1 bacterium]NIT73865.1 helix-turn-helix domain-containing protein [candidate division KSB1 bacterium]NIU27770.1 helix-turn-helix domain-containing protein [candidate division KSB1 bacterium]
MEVLEKELDETLKAWSTVSKVVSTLDTENQYKKAVELLDKLIDEVSEEEDPLIESLIDTLGTLIKDYEDRKLKEPEGDPVGCLEYLMEEHGLRQRDLRELGSQGVVSEILHGKRQLNVRQIKALSKRFNVSPAVFI